MSAVCAALFADDVADEDLVGAERVPVAACLGCDDLDFVAAACRA